MRRFSASAVSVALALAACGPDREDSVTPGPLVPGPRAGVTMPRVPVIPQAPECRGSGAFDGAALQNGTSVREMPWSPFGRVERGWEVYEAKIAEEIGTRCSADSPAFAEALSRWQNARRMAADGVLDEEVFMRMKNFWHAQRPYITIRGEGCPAPPPESELAWASPSEGYKGKLVQLRPPALEAYRRMRAAALAEVPEIARDPDMLTIFSAYRSPSYDAERCAREGNCNGITRASCSPHRTGLVVDLVVGAAPGHTVDSSADVNRLYMTRTPAYRWLVANAHRFGFVNYVFEPWHWEYTGAGAQARPVPPVFLPRTESGTRARGSAFQRDKEPARDAGNR